MACRCRSTCIGLRRTDPFRSSCRSTAGRGRPDRPPARIGSRGISPSEDIWSWQSIIATRRSGSGLSRSSMCARRSTGSLKKRRSSAAIRRASCWRGNRRARSSPCASRIRKVRPPYAASSTTTGPSISRRVGAIHRSRIRSTCAGSSRCSSAARPIKSPNTTATHHRLRGSRSPRRRH